MFVTLWHIAERKPGRRKVVWRRRLERQRFERAQRGKRDRSGSDQTHPGRRGMDGNAAKDAGMGESMMTKRQQNDLDIHRAQTGRPGLGANEQSLCFVSHAMKN